MTDTFRALCAELVEYSAPVDSISQLTERLQKLNELAARARALLAQPVALSDIGQEWRPCVKLPITVHVRDQRPGETHSSTREGITPLRSDDLIMRGVRGEEYPIGRDLFEQTYELLPTPDAL